MGSFGSIFIPEITSLTVFSLHILDEFVRHTFASFYDNGVRCLPSIVEHSRARRMSSFAFVAGIVVF